MKGIKQDFNYVLVLTVFVVSIFVMFPNTNVIAQFSGASISSAPVFDPTKSMQIPIYTNAFITVGASAMSNVELDMNCTGPIAWMGPVSKIGFHIQRLIGLTGPGGSGDLTCVVEDESSSSVTTIPVVFIDDEVDSSPYFESTMHMATNAYMPVEMSFVAIDSDLDMVGEPRDHVSIEVIHGETDPAKIDVQVSENRGSGSATITWIPYLEDTGPNVFTVKARSGTNEATVTARVNVTDQIGNNTAPVFSKHNTVQIPVHETVNVPIIVTDVEGNGAIIDCSSPNLVQQYPSTYVGSNTVLTSVDLYGMPYPAHSFLHCAAIDYHNNTSTIDIPIIVTEEVDHPPVFGSVSNGEAKPYETVNLTFNATDPDLNLVGEPRDHVSIEVIHGETDPAKIDVQVSENRGSGAVTIAWTPYFEDQGYHDFVVKARSGANVAIARSRIHVTPPQVCGNGILEGNEACDDGNLVSGDGCSRICTIENTNPSCFIATAAYGTPLAEDIDSLRALRDEHLLNNKLGREFVGWYYKNSPHVAERIAEKPWLKSTVRVLLKPIVEVSEWMVK